MVSEFEIDLELKRDLINQMVLEDFTNRPGNGATRLGGPATKPRSAKKGKRRPKGGEIDGRRRKKSRNRSKSKKNSNSKGTRISEIRGEGAKAQTDRIKIGRVEVVEDEPKQRRTKPKVVYKDVGSTEYIDSISNIERDLIAEAYAKTALLIMENNRLQLQIAECDRALGINPVHHVQRNTPQVNVAPQTRYQGYVRKHQQQPGVQQQYHAITPGRQQPIQQRVGGSFVQQQPVQQRLGGSFVPQQPLPPRVVSNSVVHGSGVQTSPMKSVGGYTPGRPQVQGLPMHSRQGAPILNSGIYGQGNVQASQRSYVGY